VNILKRLQYIHPYERWMFASVALATLLRGVLIYFNWPFTDSDEGNMGVLALHVAYRGAHPIFFYGGNYLGPLEGYAAAPLFRLFGSSLFTLRLPLLLFFTFFLLSMYYLLRLLYSSKQFALASVILLGLGSPDVLFLQLRASGEYPEIEMFAALMCLLAAWLALSARGEGEPGRRQRWQRHLGYGFLGLIIGLALWVDLLILPFVAAVGLLLWFLCRRELLGRRGLSLLLGLLVGALPLIYYNLTAPWQQNSFFVLMGIDHGGADQMQAQHLTWLNQLSGTMIVSLPMATGGSLHCPLSAIPPAGSPTSATLPCVLFQAGWGSGYVILWFLAAGLAVYALWRCLRHAPAATPAGATFMEERQEAIRQAGRLMLLGGAGLTLLLYAMSPSSATYPDTSFRYLACLLLVIPVLSWPLWQGLCAGRHTGRRIKPGLLLRGGSLLLLVGTFVWGMLWAFTQIPTTRAVHASQEALVQDLLQIGATRVYSNYWTCNILTYLSREKIICSALDEHLNPGYDRYPPYRSIVRAAPLPTYIFSPGTSEAEAMQQRVSQAASRYRRYTFEGYLVYQQVT
jgi:hypothetical protein